MERPEAEPAYLSVKEAASLLNTDRADVRCLCKEGKLQGAYQERANGPWRIPQASVRRLMPPAVDEKASVNPESLPGLGLTIQQAFPGFAAAIRRNPIAVLLLAIIVPFIVAFIGFASNSVQFVTGVQEIWDRYAPSPLSTPTATPVLFPPANEDEFLVLLADVHDQDGHDPQRYAMSLLEQLHRTFASLPNTRVEHLPVTIPAVDGQAEATRLAKLPEHNASMVIWGDYVGGDSPELYLYFTVIAPERGQASFSKAYGPSDILSPDAFTFKGKLSGETSAVAVLMKAQVLYAQASYQEAITLFDSAIVNGVPNSTTALKALFYSGRGESRVQMALNTFSPMPDGVIGMLPDPQSEGFIETVAESLYTAIEDFTTALEFDPESASALVSRGRAYAFMGDYNAALPDLVKATELNQDAWTAHMLLANIYSGLRQNENALAELNKAIDLAPDEAELYSNRAGAHNSLGDQEAALRDQDKAIALKPNLAASYSNRGLTHMAMGNIDLAINDYLKGIDVDPNFTNTYLNLGIAYKSKRDWPRAIETYTQALEKNPELIQALTARAALYEQNGDYQLALGDLSRIVELRPGDPQAYVARGGVLLRNNDYRAAIADYSAAIDLNPNVVDNYGRRGIAYVMNEDWQQSVDDFSQLLMLEGDTGAAYGYRGLAYLGLKQFSPAWADFDKAIELAPSTPLAYYGRSMLRYTLGYAGEARTDLQQYLSLAASDDPFMEAALQLRTKLGSLTPP